MCCWVKGSAVPDFSKDRKSVSFKNTGYPTKLVKFSVRTLLGDQHRVPGMAIATDWKIPGWNRSMSKTHSLWQSVQTGSRAHPPSCKWEPGCFRGIKAARA
jgi:hypothetical protein